MSDDLPNTPIAAIRAFLAIFALGAVLEGRSGWHHGETILALEYWFAGAVIFSIAGFWEKIQKRGGPRFTATASALATDFRAWILAIAFLLELLALSPFVEQGRWPFSSSAIAVPTQEKSDPTSGALSEANGQVAALTKQLSTAQQDRDSARTQLAQMQQQISTKSPARWTKAEVTRLQDEVFTLYKLLNETRQQLRAPLDQLQQNGMAIVDAQGQQKSAEMVDSYIDAVNNLYRGIVIDAQNNMKFDWSSDLSALIPDAGNKIGLTITILRQYRGILLAGGDFHANILQRLPGEQRNLDTTLPDFFSWIDESMKRCEDKKAELQEALQHTVD